MPKRPTDEDFKRFDAHLRAMVKEHGWAVQGVFPTEDEPDGVSWLYTIGLWERFQHPEIVVFGLPMRIGHAILNSVGERVRDGELFPLDYPIKGIIGNEDSPPCQFVKVPHAFVTRAYNYFNVGRSYYGGTKFKVVQLVWPDAAGKLPWDDGYDFATYGAAQPLLTQAALDAAGS